jgi:hypothetical protein
MERRVHAAAAWMTPKASGFYNYPNKAVMVKWLVDQRTPVLSLDVVKSIAEAWMVKHPPPKKTKATLRSDAASSSSAESPSTPRSGAASSSS